MSDVPAGWYNDPEQPGQNRYWDGTQWTEHRAPKVPSGGGSDGGSAWGIVPGTFSLLGRYWREFVMIAAPLAVLSLAGFVAVLAGFDRALNVDVINIYDRVTEPGFDQADNGVDEAFLDSIEFSIGAGSVVLWMIALAAFTFGGLIGGIVVARFAVGARFENPPALGDAYLAAASRAPRMIGLVVVYAIAMTVAVAAIVGVAFVAPLSLLITAPALAAGVLWSIPLLTAATTVIGTGPRAAPAWTTAVELLRGRWWAFFGRLLIIYLIVFLVGIPRGIIGAPVFAASVWGGIVVNVIFQTAQTIVTQVGVVHVYLWADGPLDPALQTSESLQ
jgi:hypothetical protein